MKSRTMFFYGVVALMFNASLSECREYKSITTPQGQTLTVIGEAKDRSELINNGDAMFGSLAQGTVQAFRKIEDLRGGNLVIATLISQSEQSLNWPAGQWIECVLTDSSIQRAKSIFTCGPLREVRVIELGREGRRIPLDQLLDQHAKGAGDVAHPIYFVVPHKKMSAPNGRTRWMEFQDIATIRFVRIPVDSINAVAERRN